MIAEEMNPKNTHTHTHTHTQTQSSRGVKKRETERMNKLFHLYEI